MSIVRRAVFGPLSLIAAAGAPAASGQGHEAVVICDPANAESMYVANVYAAARSLPASNVLCFSPNAPDFQSLADVNHTALTGLLGQRRVSEADYILLTSGQNFRVAAEGLVSDGCSTVSRFALASSYALAPFADDILDGAPSTLRNEYFGEPSIAFDAQTNYFFGQPAVGNGRRTFIAAHLGYTGNRGNTLQEVLDTITRGVASDFSNPSASIELARTSDINRSGPRHDLYPEIVDTINAEGGNAVTYNANLPGGGVQIAGVMTGLATPDIDGGDFTIAPGAYCDHLTSFAGDFSTSSQTKMSRWIAKGATLTSGAVQEPCNYPSKFPSARLFLHATRGLTLGEAYLRSAGAVPFQIMLMGDPLARPWGTAPEVTIPDLPAGHIGRMLTFTPQVSTTRPGAAIDHVEVYIEGVHRGSYAPGQTVTLNTTHFGSGFRELRVVAIDDSEQQIPGEWIGLVELANNNASASLSVDSLSGTLTDTFEFSLDAPGSIRELRLLHHGRVVASAASSPATITLHGHILGAGPATIVAEAELTNGDTARSAPLTLDIAYDDTAPSDGAQPTAFGYNRTVRSDTDEFVLELPADHADDPSQPIYRIVTPPTGAAMVTSGGFAGDGPYRVFRRSGSGAGTDTVEFEIEDSQGRTSRATINLVYPDPLSEFCFVDLDFDGQVTPTDFGAWLSWFNLGHPFADINRDGMVTPTDFGAWLTAFNAGCDF